MKQFEETVEPDAKPQWHTRLVAALEECKPYERTKTPVGGCLGIIAFVIAVNIVGVVILGVVTEGGGPPPPIWVVLIFFAGVFLARIFVVYPLMRAMIKRSKASLSRSALQEVLEETKRRPVVYLRSFSMDDDLGQIHWTHKYFGNGLWYATSLEEKMSGQLAQYGPAIAIGKPDEDLPELGAARFYATNDKWQEKILIAIESSQLVLWMTGVTDGLEWEIKTLTKNVSPSKLLIACHPHFQKLSKNETEEEWTRFLEKMGEHFPHPFPDLLGDTKFFIFDEKWKPIPVSGRKHIVALRSALDLLESSGTLQPRRQGLGVGTCLVYMAFPLFGVITGATIGGFIGEAPGFLIGCAAGFLVGMILGIVYLRIAIRTWKTSS